MEIKRILIGIDDSEFADYAAGYGFAIARSFYASVGLVHIVEPVNIPDTTTTDTTFGLTNMGMPLEGAANVEMMHLQDEQSDNIINRTIKKYGEDIQISHFTEYGSTADGIIKCSHEFAADLIVIGTHQRSGLDRLFMGSVAESVIRHSDIPVLIVPHKEEK